VWGYDFIEDRTQDGRKFRALCVLDEFTRRCLAIVARRRFSAHDVVEVLTELMIVHGVPEHIRSDQGPEFVAKVVQDWIGKVGAKTAYIEKGSPWENGYVERFHSKLRDALLDRELFYSLREAQVLIESWRVHDNAVRPHSALG
jgi:putative transposase